MIRRLAVGAMLATAAACGRSSSPAAAPSPSPTVTPAPVTPSDSLGAMAAPARRAGMRSPRAAMDTGRPDWCPELGAEIGARATGGVVSEGVSPPAPMRDTSIRLDARTTIDTTAVFSIDERRWRWARLAAWVAAGASGGGGGRLADPAGTDSAAWHACVGIGLTMRDATLLLRRAEGTVRLKVDLSPLARLRSPDSAGVQPRR